MPDAAETPGWPAFQAARQRFFDRLAADAAQAGLETAWRLPALEPTGHDTERPERGTEPSARAADD
jgi:hypothetical protein